MGNDNEVLALKIKLLSIGDLITGVYEDGTTVTDCVIKISPHRIGCS